MPDGGRGVQAESFGETQTNDTKGEQPGRQDRRPRRGEPGRCPLRSEGLGESNWQLVLAEPLEEARDRGAAAHAPEEARRASDAGEALAPHGLVVALGKGERVCEK